MRCARAANICGLDLSQNDAGDGAAALVILVLGAIIVGLAFWTEFRFAPPLWLHAILWPVMTVPLAILMIRLDQGWPDRPAIPSPRLRDGVVTGSYRRLLWPGIMTAVMLMVLLGLGTWQVKRLFWKQGLLAQIAQAEAAAPIPLAQIDARGTLSPFMKISVTGTFLPDETALYGAEVRDVTSGPAMGAQLIEPMREVNGKLILVDRGWVPLSRYRAARTANG